MPIRKTGEGKFHVEGELVVCGKEAQVKLFKLMTPLWMMDESVKLVVVCPLLQYIKSSCCEDEDHIPNRRLQNYESKLRGDLEALKQNLKMFLHTGGHHHCRVMDPLVDTKEMEVEKMWGPDPTKPTAEVFDKMAAGIHAVEVRLKLKRQAAASASHTAAAPAPKVRRAENGRGGRSVTVGSGRIAGGQYQDMRVVTNQADQSGRGWEGRTAGGQYQFPCQDIRMAPDYDGARGRGRGWHRAGGWRDRGSGRGSRGHGGRLGDGRDSSHYGHYGGQWARGVRPGHQSRRGYN
jgi:hypothetical protein